MPVITFASSKGGAGKSTSALVVACELAEKYKVIIIDADPRHPITDWADGGAGHANISVVKSRGTDSIQDEIEDAAQKVPFVVVDLEGTASQLATFAMLESDFIVVASKKTVQDGKAALQTLSHIKRVGRSARRTLPATLLFTQTKGAAKGETAIMIEQQMREHPDLDVFEAEMVEREAFSAIFAKHVSVRAMAEQKPSNKGYRVAIENAAAVASQVLDRVRKIQRSDAA